MKTICFARLRGRIHYTEPLKDILDSFCYCMKIFMQNNPQYNYTFYDTSFDPNVKPSKNLDALKEADIIIIPTEQEFHYHTPNYFHPQTMKRSHEAVEKALPFIDGKHVIILRSDRADDEELFTTRTFKDIKLSKFSQIDEDEWDQGIHVLKYHFIREFQNTTLFEEEFPQKLYDFCYWGSLKNKDVDGKNSGDVRHKILRSLSRVEDVKSYWIGRYIGIKRDLKMSKMRDIIPIMKQSRATLCFNWKDPKAVTSRYHEAMATYTVPLVWDNYDSTNRMVIDDWQRCRTLEDVVDKIVECRDSSIFTKLYNEYESKLQTKDEIASQFVNKLSLLVEND